jgi:hypothetical protein
MAEIRVFRQWDAADGPGTAGRVRDALIGVGVAAGHADAVGRAVAHSTSGWLTVQHAQLHWARIAPEGAAGGDRHRVTIYDLRGD